MKHITKILTIILTLSLLFIPQTNAKAETSTTVPDGLRYKIVNNEYIEITYYSGSAEALTIPSEIEGYPVKTIGDRAFADNRLRRINLPQGLTTIGNEAFLYSYYLNDITIPEGVTKIGYRAFAGISRLESVTLPDSLTTIEPYTFSQCGRLSKVTLPKSLKTISFGAFSDTMNLRYIDLPQSLTTIDSVAFSYSGLVELKLPEGLKSLGDSSFQYCKNLSKEVIVPGNLTYFGTCVFTDCIALPSVVISEGIKTLPPGTFSYCITLNDVSLPNSLEEIGGNAFVNCVDIKRVTLPNTLKTVNGDALYSLQDNEIRIRGALSKDGLEAYKKLLSNGMFNTNNIKFTFLAKEDVNKDGAFDISDLAQISFGYNYNSNTIGFNGDLDINEDKVIDLYDLVKISRLI
ncbi:MAG: leucine-rich repeat protein [Clostridium sp.]